MREFIFGSGLAALVLVAQPAGATTIQSFDFDFETRDPSAAANGSASAQSGRFNDVDDPATTPIDGIYTSEVNAYNQFRSGFKVELSTPNPTGEPLALFQSRCSGGSSNPTQAGYPGCTGGDPDLATGVGFDSPQEDLILIVNENANGAVDDTIGGDIIFDFAGPLGIDLQELVLIDLDEDLNTVDAIEFIITYIDPNRPQETILRSDFNRIDVDGNPVVGLPGLQETLVNPDFPDDNSYRRFAFDSDLARGIAQLEIDYNNISGGVAMLRYTRAVPVPGALPLMLTGAAALAFLGWRRRQAAEARA